MPYLLDGNNLIGRARGSARPSEEDRRDLVAALLERLRATRARAVLFFDGAGGRETSLGRLSVRNAGSVSADEAILREVGRARSPQEITVVTADRGLIRAVRDAGARVLSPEEFWSRFGASSRQQQREENVDIEDWVKYFEDERNRET
jgi:predicted RNA-binding protein with PIN domain